MHFMNRCMNTQDSPATHPHACRRAIALALAASTLAGCVGSAYDPPQSASAKLVYRNNTRQLVVDNRAEPVDLFSNDYVDLFDGEARDYAARSHSSALGGFALSLLAASAATTAFVIELTDDGSDFLDLDTTRGRAALGLLIGSAVAGVISGYFMKKSDARLFDAINAHNAVQRRTEPVEVTRAAPLPATTVYPSEPAATQAQPAAESAPPEAQSADAPAATQPATAPAPLPPAAPPPAQPASTPASP
jgi:hypothetical protein